MLVNDLLAHVRLVLESRCTICEINDSAARMDELLCSAKLHKKASITCVRSSAGISRGGTTDQRSTTVTFTGPQSRSVLRREVSVLCNVCNLSAGPTNLDVVSFTSVDLTKGKTRNQSSLRHTYIEQRDKLKCNLCNENTNINYSLQLLWFVYIFLYFCSHCTSADIAPKLIRINDKNYD